MTTATHMSHVARVFRRHGIHIGIAAPMFQLQELAMAINLSGSHEVNITYERNSSRDENGHALIIGAKHRDDAWTDGTGIRALVYLPSRESSESDRLACIGQLGDIAESLGRLLDEVPA